tara:strand:- start:2250 stop:3107 length:858 start_codon:yes stop_codon:yes gene_type:complete
VKNLLVYPLYKIKDRESEYLNHKINLQKNIEIVEKFACVDEIKVIGSEVNHWSLMIGDMMEQIYNFNKSGYNVLFSEIDTVFVKQFAEIFSLEKMTMFARCNNKSHKDDSLPKGYYLNSGLIYYPSNLDDNTWNLCRDKFKNNKTIDAAATSYEIFVNKMFYSQFPNMDSGIDYIRKAIGFSKYNWRGLICVSSKEVPSVTEDIKHIHFLNMSEYIQGDKNFQKFWYQEIFDNFHADIMAGNSIKKHIIDLLHYYKINLWDRLNRINIIEEQQKLVDNYIKTLGE